MADENEMEMDTESNETPPIDEDTPQSQARQGERLVITHIVNEFFKSYAGKQTLGPFHKVCSLGLG